MVKFSHEVVATRRNKALAATFDWASINDEPDADIETMTTSDTAVVTSSADHSSQRPAAAKPKPEQQAPAAEQPSNNTDKARSKVKSAFNPQQKKTN